MTTPNNSCGAQVIGGEILVPPLLSWIYSAFSCQFLNICLMLAQPFVVFARHLLRTCTAFFQHLFGLELTQH